MTQLILWIVGEPGIGKTTVARTLLQSYGPRGHEYQSPKWTCFGNVAGAGHWRGTKFDGADTLPISDIKLALPFFVNVIPAEIAILDGDKLASQGAVQFATEVDCKLMCFHLIGSETALRRRLARGTHQQEHWVAGRRTKAQNFYNRFPGTRYEVPSIPDTSAIVQLIRDSIER
jgi:hypothetical protein